MYKKYVNKLLKNMWKTFSIGFLLSMVLVFINYLFLGFLESNKQYKFFYKFQKFLQNKKEDVFLDDTESIYAYLGNLINILNKMKNSSHGFPQFLNREKEFLNTHVHKYIMYKNLLLFAMLVNKFDGKEYFLDSGALNFYGRAYDMLMIYGNLDKFSGEKLGMKNVWMLFYIEYIKFNKSRFLVPIEGCDEKKIQSMLNE